MQGSIPDHGQAPGITDKGVTSDQASAFLPHSSPGHTFHRLLESQVSQPINTSGPRGFDWWVTTEAGSPPMRGEHLRAVANQRPGLSRTCQRVMDAIVFILQPITAHNLLRCSLINKYLPAKDIAGWSWFIHCLVPHPALYPLLAMWLPAALASQISVTIVSQLCAVFVSPFRRFLWIMDIRTYNENETFLLSLSPNPVSLKRLELNK